MAVNAFTHKWNVLRGGLGREKYSDLKLVTEMGQSVSCHKLVMSNVSQKIKAVLDKKNINQITVRNVKYQGLKNVITFIYDGKVEIPDAEQLIDFADCYTLLNVNLGPKIGKSVKNITLNKGGESDSDNSSQEIQFRCANCEKSFTKQKQLSRHVREVHEKEKQKIKQTFACEKCGLVFTVIFFYF